MLIFLTVFTVKDFMVISAVLPWNALLFITFRSQYSHLNYLLNFSLISGSNEKFFWN